MTRKRIEFAPQRRARVPRYPSFRDPRPGDVGGGERSLAGRAARQLATVTLGLSLPAGAALAGSGKATAPAGQTNPFALKRSGFPIHPIRYGTGQPSRLSEADARAVISKVLRKAGVRLVKDVDPKLPGVVVNLDGWEAKRRVGFEFVSWSDYEYNSGFRVGRIPRSGLSFAEIKRLAKQSVAGKSYVAVVNQRRYPYGRNAAHTYPPYRATLEKLRKTSDPKQRKRLEAERGRLIAEVMRLGKTMAMRRLEADMREFVAWLRAQGAL